ncbi:MAG: 2-hydroxychromene-2-carboxylate isomerase, partial [Alphaproteobacteria bacterium]|nr:2-hydroxychromene-2-carboxylate isomerase [Alphaproteobacteria bacterium]
MADSPIDFYFDFSSPFGYLASERIDDIAGRHGRTTVWRPFLLGAVFKIVGTAPLLDYPMKGDYSRRDMVRSARL